MLQDIGHVMGKSIIAELVETEEPMTALSQIGVADRQGYGIARPIPFDAGFGPISFGGKSMRLRTIA